MAIEAAAVRTSGTTVSNATTLRNLAHPLQVRRALDVQIVLGRAAGHQRKHDVDEQHRL